MRYDAVFEGGGVKGIGLAGAVFELEHRGFQAVNTAGTSAGAIVACLISAGYSSAEIKEILQSTDFKKFRESSLLSKIGTFGKTLNILFKYGIYSPDYFETWLNELLAAKGVTRFSHIKTNEPTGFRFQAVASDISNKSLLILPGALKQFGLAPESFSIAKAVRMSMSIPIYYEPYKLTDIDNQKHLIVDGGLLSNYPIWLLDTEELDRPVFGFKFSNPQKNEHHCNGETCIHNIVDYTKALAGTALDAHDNYYISTSKGNKQRTIFISTVIDTGRGPKNIGTTDFDITREESDALFQNGIDAAKEFLSRWDYEYWRRSFKSQAVKEALIHTSERSDRDSR